MKIIQLEVGYLGTNCYIVYDENTLQAAIIDPGGSADKILKIVEQENLAVEMIINTHGHADHISGNSEIKKATGAPILIHKDDAVMITNAHSNLSVYVGNGMESEPADRLLSDGDNIKLGSILFTVVHTPGHTPGGICLIANNEVFCGDTIFYESIGRTDFPGGSYRQLIQSIKDKLMTLNDEVNLYPGHGPATTVGWERRRNPFIQ